MNDEQKKTLLKIVRKVIEATVKGQPVGTIEADDPVFKERRGCFVTIHNHGRLRGCIGQFQPQSSLLDIACDMARAATRDSRFIMDPVTEAELPKIDIEVSVLSPLEPVDDPLSLELGRHGIYIQRGNRAGCFLPQVATETGWGKEEFLSQCCAGKAGLPADAWKDPDTTVYLFTAAVFGEKDY